MTFVVAGPKTSRLAALVANMIATGTPAVNRLFSENMPQKPAFCVTSLPPTAATLLPGHVSASKTGSAVWKVK